HPPMLDEVGLTSAIRWYTKGFTERSGIKVDLKLPANLGRLPSEVETALFRVVQEALTNIHRHSGSRTARIRMSHDAVGVTLTVEDQGHGLPPTLRELPDASIAGLGVGIAGMRERLRQLGGWLEIRSGDRGTLVKANMPIVKGDA
ncbi:MAG TPA: ATP-binding protein, partial [Candidatus Polarisedimenticolia bacterium]|nr:ATP-binding protein [Candidatus Polarisedimenticolia bacterium]